MMVLYKSVHFQKRKRPFPVEIKLLVIQDRLFPDDPDKLKKIFEWLENFKVLVYIKETRHTSTSAYSTV